MVLTEKDKEDIKKRKAEGETFDSLAIEYGVSMSTIARVIYPHYKKKWADWQTTRYRKAHPRIFGRTIVVKPNEAFRKIKKLLESMFSEGMPVPDLEITVRPVREKKEDD